MNTLTIFAIAIGLAMDATAVAIAASVMLGRVTAWQVFRFGFHFGLFQATMPVLGWLAGQGFADIIADWDHWVAFGFLAAIGAKELHETWRGSDEGGHQRTDPTRGWSLVVLSVATSIDALAVGLSLGLLGGTLWLACLVIGAVTAVMTVTAMLLGSRLGERTGHGVRALGGIILIGIGIKILIEHLTIGGH